MTSARTVLVCHVEEMAIRVNNECFGESVVTILSPSKRRGLLGMADDCDIDEITAGSSDIVCGFTTAQVQASISYYKSLPQIPEDEDPLFFWKAHDNSGSMLAPLIEAVAEVLAIPATEAICERIFRRAGEVLTKYRMSLLGENFERILMANYNAPKWQGGKGVDISELNERDATTTD